jgi:hypothetical protein
MVYLYTCSACSQERHEDCEIGHPAPKGVMGGSKCLCSCNGRSEEQRDKDWDETVKRTLNNEKTT